jgi:hypothetical protein
LWILGSVESVAVSLRPQATPEVPLLGAIQVASLRHPVVLKAKVEPEAVLALEEDQELEVE